MMSEGKPLMMLSVPNSGTDWLAQQICECDSSLYYCREFFNPITNESCSTLLSGMFGCEMASLADRIAGNYSWEQYNAVVQQTWLKHGYNFTKENYSAFQIKHHVRLFTCFVLYRELRYCLPGANPYRYYAVKTWYDALYHSLLVNRSSLDADIARLVDYAQANADTFNKQQASAHVIYNYQLLKTANDLGLPVIEYRVLAAEDELSVAEHLSRVAQLRNVEELARKIVSSRRPRQDSFGQLGCEDYIRKLTSLLPPPLAGQVHGLIALRDPDCPPAMPVGNGEHQLAGAATGQHDPSSGTPGSSKAA